MTTYDCARCCWRWLRLFCSKNRTCGELIPWDCWQVFRQGCVEYKDDDHVGNTEPEVVVVVVVDRFVKLLFCCLGDYLGLLVLPSCGFPNSQM